MPWACEIMPSAAGQALRTVQGGGKFAGATYQRGIDWIEMFEQQFELVGKRASRAASRAGGLDRDRLARGPADALRAFRGIG